MSDIEGVKNSWRSGRSWVEFDVARKNNEEECEKSETVRFVKMRSTRAEVDEKGKRYFA